LVVRLTGLTALLLALFVVPDLSAVADRPEKKKKVDPVDKEIKEFQGTWEMASLEFAGRQYRPNDFGARFANTRMVIRGKKLTCQAGGQTTTITLKVNIKKYPRELNAVGVLFARGKAPGIYVLQGNTLKICLPRLGNQRPTDFNTRNGNNRNYVVTWQRTKS
jgi:uncharacterized protein (TIGR03067 family)